MAREWNAVTGEHVRMGDIADARFERAVVWTFLVFFAPRPGNDERGIFEKNNRQFYVRVAKSNASPNASVFTVITGLGTLSFLGTNTLTTDKWYLAAVTNNGTETTNDMHVYLMESDETLTEDADFTGDADIDPLTGETQYGTLIATSDEYDGGIFCGSYFKTREFSLQDVKNYLRSPYRVARQYAADNVFFHPLLSDASPEPDWSGNGNNGTVTGTNYGIIGNPPIGPLIGLDLGWQGNVAAAAAAVVRRPPHQALLGVGR